MSHKLARSRLMARTWPHGDGCLWNEVRSREVERIDPDDCSLIGLSNVSNFNSSQDGPLDGLALRHRGRNGITRYGRSMVRSSAMLLEKAYGKECLSFITCTLPGTPEETSKAASAWASICNRFVVSLRRFLKASGLPDLLVYVTEIQESRFLATGGMPLHLHLVMVGRRSVRSGWDLSPSRLQSMWARSVSPDISPSELGGFSASCNIQQVRNSAAGYLGKYISKGSSTIELINRKHPELVDFLPSAWWGATRAMKAKTAQHTAYGSAHGEAIAEMLEHPARELYVRWSRVVDIRGSDGGLLGTAVVYSLTSKGLALLGLGEPIRGVFTYPEC